MVRQWLIPLREGSVSNRLVMLAGLGLGFCLAAAGQQVILVNTAPASGTSGGSIDRRYSQVEPTKVDLPKQPIDARGHQDILRTLVAEQGFAMRPLPRGKKGIFLAANGKLTPSGESYVNEVTTQGLSAKPGDRVVLSNVRIDKEKIIFDINGGPDHKHEFLRHIQVGMGSPNMTNPVVQDPGQEPVGARITLSFAKYVPDVTPAQVKALLAPLISFDMKTPVQAYTDTLPPKLKEAILSHHVMVGMSTDMVLFAMGQPESKSREVEGQMPFEEWIYGHPPQDVQFVRVNGNRVIRVEVAKLGQPLEVFTKDEVEGLMTTDGKPVLASVTHDQHTIELGDVHRNADTQAPAAPPTLRAPGEQLPDDKDSNTPGTMNREGPMKPVIFPKDTTNAPARTVDAHPDAAKPDAAKKDAGTADAAAKDKAATDGADDSGNSDKSDKPDGKPQAAPAAQPAQPPTSDFFSDWPQPATM
ncbi:DUF2845 domain-containing protein [Acidicapsa acidisoli]|uniref:DUF2845 domain-containing protein n=1 Tax=Acidicapsa acidisoli TaxID=1615681 RepID=UPI0021DFA0EC|nr:DUF2845 domain-containing protein [Acidicapsa acidisoli]